MNPATMLGDAWEALVAHLRNRKWIIMGKYGFHIFINIYIYMNILFMGYGYRCK